ncbi:MAG: murein transglycosylase A [Acetobacteraceae bacterium]
MLTSAANEGDQRATENKPPASRCGAARRRGKFSIGTLVAVGLGLSGCAIKPPPGAAPAMALTPVSVEALPGWRSDHVAAGVEAFQESCARLLTLPADQKLGGHGLASARGGEAGQWSGACTAARAVPEGDEAAARAFLARYLEPYQVRSNGSASVLFSGYFEPEVAGSLRRTSRYDIPLYPRPPDLVQADLGDFVPDLAGRLIAGRVRAGRLVPYYTRAEIRAGALDGEDGALLWLADPIAAFVLQIQGSGRVKLPNGELVRVGYAGKNGQPYVPIGRVLTERGDIPKGAVTLQSIEAWLRLHPGKADAVMDQNPSYVFFRILHGIPPDKGAPGALGVPLAPGRALAVDERFIPLGAPVWIATSAPAGGSPPAGSHALDRLMVAEDIGGAIKTPLRADIFFGWGASAKEQAGRMDARGAEYVLLPRPAAAPTAGPAPVPRNSAGGPKVPLPIPPAPPRRAP